MSARVRPINSGAGQGYSRSRTELGKVAGIDREGVTFAAANPAGGSAKDTRHNAWCESVDWVDGKPCVTYIDSMFGARLK
jgi:uncharacterized cupin superfamily protein